MFFTTCYCYNYCSDVSDGTCTILSTVPLQPWNTPVLPNSKVAWNPRPDSDSSVVRCSNICSSELWYFVVVTSATERPLTAAIKVAVVSLPSYTCHWTEKSTRQGRVHISLVTQLSLRVKEWWSKAAIEAAQSHSCLDIPIQCGWAEIHTWLRFSC